MKHFSIFSKKLFITYIFALILAPSSCTLDSTIIPPISSTVDACEFEQYSQYGKFFYEHLKFNLVNDAPEKLLPVVYQSTFMHIYDSLTTAMAGLDFVQKLNHFNEGGLISNNLYLFYTQLDSLLTKVGSEALSYEQVQVGIQQLAASKKADSNYLCIEKSYIVGISSILSNYMTYLNEVGWLENNLQPAASPVNFRSCSFLEIFECTIIGSGGFLGGALLGAVAGALAGIGINIGIDIIGLEINQDTSFIGAVIIGAIVGSVYGMLNALHGCCNTDVECKPVLGVSLAFSSCNPTATYKAFGFGIDDISLVWANVGGTPAASTMTTSIPSLTITQTASTTPITTGIISVCSNSSTNISPSFVRNLSSIASQILGVTLHGNTEIPREEVGETFTYYLAGFNPNRYVVDTWGAWHGTIVNSSNDSVDIIWDDIETKGEVFVRIKNICPNGETKSYVLKVNIGNGNMH